MSAALDLYPQLGLPPMTDAERKRKNRAPRGGYIAMPGGGPSGETCGSCAHIARFERWRKCRLAEAAWTHSRGSDILARSPACRRWEKPA